MIADHYVKGKLSELTVDQLDHVAALLVEDQREADEKNDIDLYLRCIEALDDVLDERMKQMSKADPKSDPKASL